MLKRLPLKHRSIEKTFLIVFFAFLHVIPRAHSQSNNAEAALYNIGVGSVFSGVGAIINKKPGDDLGKVVLKAMAQGALGGYLVYESKILVGKIARYEKMEYAWPAKFVNSAGVSIIENAASNRNFWEQWNLNIGFNRIEFHTGERFSVNYKIMPAALLLTGYAAIGNKFEWNLSARTGEFVFSGNTYYKSKVNYPIGAAIGTSLILDPPLGFNYSTLAHEIIHIYQYHDFNVFNTFINKPLDEFAQGSLFFKKANKIFHYDFNIVLFAGGYLAERFKVDTSTKRGYYKNYFEHEAYYYSN